MDYSEIAEAYSRIEATTKRLEMTEILVELFTKAKDNPELLRKIIYLTMGKLAPDFEAMVLGLAEKLALKAVYEGTRVDEAKINDWWMKEGDLGIVAFEAVSMKKQTSLFSEPLTAEGVFTSLNDIALAEGSGSQEKKMKIFAKLLHDSTKLEAKYLARMLNGKMRLGIANMTIVDALAQTFGEKEDKPKVENAYNVCSDLGKVARVLADKGVEGLDAIKVEANIPLKAMLCERLPSIPDIIEKIGKCSFEFKYDGLRIQAHIWLDPDEGQRVELYTRQLERATAQFPDVVQSLKKAFMGKKVILDGECVPIDINTGQMLPFQEVSRRRGRKTDLAAAVKDYPVSVFLFDCLFLDGEELINTPYPERRERLASCIETSDEVRISEGLVTDDADEAENFFQLSIDGGCEGIIAKSIAGDSFYRAGSRGWQWIKFKRDYRSELDDTVDLAVIGAFAGRGRRAGKYGALLMATYNHDRDVFESVTKLGTGFNDEMLAYLPQILDEHKEDKMPARVDSKMKPDFWFQPVVIMEVKGAEITLSPIHTSGLDEIRKDNGLAIRFPRFIGIREDKGPEDATTTEEMVKMYNLQLKTLE
ncbi:MAG: ATP-dependent DNA ligase [Thermoplasmata archaeon]|nr:ATP-dependent DNA ligase [Thermoplasmata archaeon]